MNVSKMFSNKCVLMSGFILIMAMLNFADADESYMVSFVAGKSGLGLVNVKQTDSDIKVTKPAITRFKNTFGSTAVVSYRSGWDGGIYCDLTVTYGGDAAEPIKTKLFSFFNAGTSYESKLTHRLGQYHPLHVIQTSNDTRILAAGPFSTTRANDFVSYQYGSSEREISIFANRENRSAGTAAVAPDGRLVTQMTYARLNHVALGQVLDSKGNPVGLPFQLFTVNDFQGYSQSLSNRTRSGIRYLAYRNFREPGTANSKSKVMIQDLDAKTGHPKGKSRGITNFEKALNVEAEKFQSIALSPDGGLILFTLWNDECKKQILFADSIVNGSAAGRPKVVVGCGQLEQYKVGVYGISITETPQ